MIGHASEHDAVPVREAAGIRSASIVPFSGAEGGIAGGAEMFAQRGVLCGDVLSAALQMKQIPAGMQHGPARHTYRAGGAAGNVGAGEGGACLGQCIQMRGVNLGIAGRAQRIEPLIIGKEKEDVGFGRH